MPSARVRVSGCTAGAPRSAAASGRCRRPPRLSRSAFHGRYAAWPSSLQVVSCSTSAHRLAAEELRATGRDERACAALATLPMRLAARACPRACSRTRTGRPSRRRARRRTGRTRRCRPSRTAPSRAMSAELCSKSSSSSLLTSSRLDGDVGLEVGVLARGPRSTPRRTPSSGTLGVEDLVHLRVDEHVDVGDEVLDRLLVEATGANRGCTRPPPCSR